MKKMKIAKKIFFLSESEVENDDCGLSFKCLLVGIEIESLEYILFGERACHDFFSVVK